MVKIILTKRKLTRAGKIMLWSNILFTLLWVMNLTASIRSIIKYGGWFWYQLVGVFLLPALIVFWVLFSNEECFIEKYTIKLDAKRGKHDEQ